VLLAPSRAEVPDSFGNVQVYRCEHARLLARMQRLRGAMYLEDGAIEPDELTSDGCHRTYIDDDSWHLLAVDESGQVCGCARYLQHRKGVSFCELMLHNSALAHNGKWGKMLRQGVESELAYARMNDLAYVEAGGWVLSQELRGSTEALRMALGTFALARILGGCLGASTATMRHCSASILKRIGGRPLAYDGVDLPPYYDPQYKCEMAMLRFDSRYPNPKYERCVEEIRNHLRTIPVFCSRRTRMYWENVLRPLPKMADVSC